MTEHNLENLKDLPVPSPSADAKRAAMAAALKAFDTASTGANSGPKGNVVPLRQTETSPTKRSFLMRFSTPQYQALAASIAAMMIVAPLAFQHLRSVRDAKTFGAIPTELSNAFPGGGGLAQEKNKSEQPRADLAQHEPKSRDAETRHERDAIASANTPQGAGKPRTVGQQSLSSDNGYSGSPTPAPAAQAPASGAAVAVAPAKPADGLGAVGGYAGQKQDRDRANKIAVTPAPAAAPSQGGDARGPALAIGGDAPATAGKGSGYVAGNNYDLSSSTKFTGQPRIARDSAIAARLGEQSLGADIAVRGPQSWMGQREQHDEQSPVLTEENRDKFNAAEINSVKQVTTEPVSTFSIDVDTASYSFVRRALNAGHLPPKDAVRVEEMINYFPYNYPSPESAETPFKPTLTVMPSPWNLRNKLVHVAIKGYDLKSAERPRANLVLLMDVSGSMQPQDRLPLVKNAFRLLIDQLKPDDTVGIVTYASGSGIALEPTKVADKSKILAALDKLGAGGSTAGAAGIQDAYRLAEAGFDKTAVNRIILATDGDFNVGITDQNELKGFIERKRQSGIFLSILGVGQGNHNDALMQTLAQNGNGTAAYADTLNEARKVLVEESSSTLFTIAKDVKVQIEWNPERVAEYRLIGYETRALKREDFNNDKIDAGDIGSGHTVTAIYEVTPVGAPVLTDDLRYGKKVTATTENARREPAATTSRDAELGFLKLRYKRPNEDVSNLVSLPINDSTVEDSASQVSADVRFSIAVAAFGQMLRGTPYTSGYSYDDILARAQTARGDDPFGYRAEFLNLVRLAKSARP